MNLVKAINKYQSKIERIFLGIFLMLLLTKLAIIFFQNINTPPLTTDSWAYFIISKTMFSDFGFTNYIRQFQFISDYNISFPPLFPLLIRLSNSLVENGVYAGYLLNFCFAVLIGILLPKLTKIVTSSYLPGIFLLLILLTNYHFQTELLGARSMILSLLLLIGLFFIFLQKQLAQKHIAAIGLLAGLLTLNRFDFLLPCLLLGIILMIVSKVSKRTTFLIYTSVFVLVISPWIWYSLSHFSTWFVSDNSRSILLANKTFTLDYYPQLEKISSLFTQPFYWFAYRVVFKGGFSLILFIKDVFYNPFVQQLLSAIGVLLVTIAYIKSWAGKIVIPKPSQLPIQRLSLLAPVFLFQLFSVGLTGFLDMRYTLFFLFYICLLLVGIVYALSNSLLKPKYLTVISFVILTILIFQQIIFVIPSDVLQIAKNPTHVRQTLLSPSAIYTDIKSLVLNHDAEPVLLIDTNEIENVSAPQFAGLTTIKTIETPSNLNDFVFVALLNNYQVNFVYTTCQKWLETMDAYFVVNQTTIPNLFSLVTATKSASIINLPFNSQRDELYYQCESSPSAKITQDTAIDPLVL